MAELKAAMYALAAKYGWSKALQLIKEAISEFEQDLWDNK